MPKDYELVKPDVVAKYYKHCAVGCDQAITAKLHKWNLNVPDKFLGMQLPEMIRISSWIKSHPPLNKIADYEMKNHKIVDKPDNISDTAWQMFTEFIIARPYLKAKQGCLLSYQSAEKEDGLAIWTDVVHGNPFDLWSISRELVTEWKDSTLSADEIHKLTKPQQQAYLHKLQDDEVRRNQQKKIHHKRAVNKVGERKLQIIQNILDSHPFYFSMSLLAKTTDPSVIVQHLTQDQKRYIEERANHEIKTDA